MDADVRMKHQDQHVPVLFEQTIDLLDLAPGQTVVDGTLGGCGHACAILDRIMPGGTFIGIDRDAAAIQRAKERLAHYEGDIRIVQTNFERIDEVLKREGIAFVDRALLDLGVSSFQLEEAQRGFSYMQDAALDMRMDQTNPLSAWNVVNEYPKEKLSAIIRAYGEDKWSSRIADFIVKKREEHPINTTTELVEIIKNAVPAGARRKGPHPAKRTFQAIRIEVNNELEGLGSAIERYVDCLAPAGRIAVITFHSLEDRIVKQEFHKEENPCTCPPDFPVCVCGKKPRLRVLTRKPVVPTQEEVAENPRARSAKLRIAEKI